MILDSNIIIYSARPDYVQLARYLQINQATVRVSLIFTLEVLGFSRIESNDKLLFEAYFTSIEVLPLSRDIITEAIRLRQQRKRSLGDSIIAATALVYTLPILTNN
ncbi:type II toxin-antitoxin system VapC family toxin [Spirosoma flavum]|uniref:Type II toxin-antitoxin system VapC family toxin n=1 Tax=Spirosoma flavum TaxID=2048557 RepID=A0ABW6AGC7_9BACT